MKHTVLFFGLLFIAGCGEEKKEEDVQMGEYRKGVEGGDLIKNRLAGLQGALYRSQEGSKIHWHAWGQEAFEIAKRENRLIVALVLMPQHQDYVRFLEEIESSKTVVREFNENYLPVLVDAGVFREWVPHSANLNAESDRPLKFPMLVWMTAEVNPIAWVSMDRSNTDQGVESLFLSSHSMVLNIWQEDSAYVTNNSRLDQKNRRERMDETRNRRELSGEPAVAAVQALRQLGSQYDVTSRSFDEAGGLFPVGSIELMSYGARFEGLPAGVSIRAKEVMEYLIEDLMVSPMFDPLDGGVFSARLGNTWDMPTFYRNCDMQARVISSLVDGYEVTGRDKILEYAKGVMRFAENGYRTEDGVFGNGVVAISREEDWLWKIEDVRSVLSNEEAEVWIMATGMTEVGNIPVEVDTARKYIKSNCFRNTMDAEAIAEKTGKELVKVRGLLESSREKLLEERGKRIGKREERIDSEAACSFRMVSAYAALYRATGDGDYLDKAVKTLSKAREVFVSGLSLRVYGSGGNEEAERARAFVYGLAIQAAMDVAAITHDEIWLSWADDLMTTVGENFILDGRIQECEIKNNLLGLTVTDDLMFFEESTEGLFSLLLARMDGLGHKVVSEFADLRSGLPVSAVTIPIMHTDVIHGHLLRGYADRIAFSSPIPDEMMKLLKRVPPKLASVVAAEKVEGHAVRGVAKIGKDGSIKSIDENDRHFDHCLLKSGNPE
jgi:uncharacterized protein